MTYEPGQLIDPTTGDWVSLTPDVVRVMTVTPVDHQGDSPQAAYYITVERGDDACPQP